MTALDQLEGWPAQWDVSDPAAAVVAMADDASGGRPAVRDSAGNIEQVLPIASVTKPLVAYAVLIAVEEGALALDEDAGPPGATVRHLLAHTAGYLFESGSGVAAKPGTRRMYSNMGIEVLADHLASRSGISIEAYLHEAVFEPLGMSATELRGSPAQDVSSTVADLARFGAELLSPRLVAAETLAQMTTIQFPGLDGVLPGIGRFSPLDWGLGVERNFGRDRHWAGSRVSRETFGHFGGSGSFLWVDPTRGLAAICLSGRDFDQWALTAWPALSDAIVDEHLGTPPGD